MITSAGQDGPLGRSTGRASLEANNARCARRAGRSSHWAAIWPRGPTRRIKSRLAGLRRSWISGSEIYGSQPDVTVRAIPGEPEGDVGAGDHNVNNPPSTNQGREHINPPNGYAAGGTTNWHQYGINWTATPAAVVLPTGSSSAPSTASTDADLAALSYEKKHQCEPGAPADPVRRTMATPVGRRPGPTTTGTWWLTFRPASWELDYVRLYQPWPTRRGSHGSAPFT